MPGGRIVTLLVAGAVVGAAAPAAAATYETTSAVADALRTSAVVADSEASPAISLAAQRRIAAEIRRLAPGRIVVAYARPRLAEQAGSVEALANTLSERVDFKGVLLVVAGENVHFVTTYFDSQRALVAVRGAFERTEKTEPIDRQLIEVVRALAAVDPGPEAEEGVESIDVSGFVRTLKRIGIGLLLLVGGFVAWQAIRTRRRAAEAASRQAAQNAFGADDMP